MRHRYFTRSCGKTPCHLVNWGPELKHENWNSVIDIIWYEGKAEGVPFENLLYMPSVPNSSSPGQNGRHIAEDAKCIFLNDKKYILIRISLKCVPKGPICNQSSLVRVMGWHPTRTSHYLNQCWLSSPTYICGTSRRWVRNMAWMVVMSWCSKLNGMLG